MKSPLRKKIRDIVQKPQYDEQFAIEGAKIGDTLRIRLPNDYTIYNDKINHPPHYTKHPSGIECIQITEHMNFCLGNALKYIWRADLKNGIEDLEKAKWYLDREIGNRKKGAKP